MNEWQPIETAPKGEKEKVLIYRKSGRICIAIWDRQQFYRNPKPFWNDYGVWGINDMRADEPTHWMPLPEPPQP